MSHEVSSTTAAPGVSSSTLGAPALPPKSPGVQKFSFPTVSQVTGGLIGGSAGDSSILNPLPGVGGTVGAVVNPLGNMSDSNHIFSPGVGSMWDSVFHPPTSTPAAPPPPPTAGQASQAALTGELSQEQKMFAANTILTGGGGLDDAPTTRSASQSLLGS